MSLKQLNLLNLPQLQKQTTMTPIYPLFYNDGNNTKEIMVPVCSIKCLYSCYVDIEAPFTEGQKCPRCGEVTSSNDRFIDVGLMSLMTTNEKQIRQRKPRCLQYDPTTGEVRLLEMQKNLFASLGSMLKINLMAEIEKRKPFENLIINHNRMRDIVARTFEKVTNLIKPPVVCSWSRGRLRRDQYMDHFSALNIAFDSQPNKILCFNIVNDSGSKRSFKYKHTHVHYIQKFNRFLILQQIPGLQKRLQFLEINLNRMDLANQNLIIENLNKKMDYREFYTTAYDYINSVLYVIGGGGPTNSKTVSKAEPFKILLDSDKLKIQNMPTFQFQKFMVSSAICCNAFINGKQTLGIMAVGGVLASEILSIENFEFKPTCYFYSLTDNFKTSFAINWTQFGAYSHVVEIPQFSSLKFSHPYKDRRKPCSGALLVFGGTDDYIINAVDNRKKYGKPIIFIPKFCCKIEIGNVTVVPLGGQPISGPDVKLSNHLYPYLNDHSASIVFEQRPGCDFPMPVIRIMVPRRDSGSNKFQRCYVLEVILEEQLEKTSIIEYEAESIMSS